MSSQRKPACGAFVNHKFRSGDKTSETCLRCGWLHADVARAHREGGALREAAPQKSPHSFAEYVEEELTARRWTRDDLALHMMMSEYAFTRFSVDFMLLDLIPNGLVLSADDAKRLAYAFGTSEELWLNLWQSCGGTVKAAR